MNGIHRDHGNVCNRAAAIVIVMTRWSVKDLTGRLIDAQAKEPKADQWEIIEFPADAAKQQAYLAGILGHRFTDRDPCFVNRAEMASTVATKSYSGGRLYSLSESGGKQWEEERYTGLDSCHTIL